MNQIYSLFTKVIFIFTLFLFPFSAFAKNTNTKEQAPQFKNKSTDNVFEKLEGIEKNIDKLPDKLVGIEKTIGESSNDIRKEISKTNNEIGVFTSETINILEKMSGPIDKWISWTLTILLILVAVFQTRMSNWIMRPKLCIKKEVKYRGFEPGGYPYIACRILVENKGRSAAQDCKAYIIVKEIMVKAKEKATNQQKELIVKENSKERVCWMVPAERPNATINKDDIEELDFCAFLNKEEDEIFPENIGEKLLESLPEAIFPNENKWPDPAKAIEGGYGLLKKAGSPLRTNDKYVIFQEIVEECEVLITASNAKSAHKEVIIDYQNKQIKLT